MIVHCLGWTSLDQISLDLASTLNYDGARKLTSTPFSMISSSDTAHVCLHSRLVLGAGGYILSDSYNTMVTYSIFSAASYKEESGFD